MTRIIKSWFYLTRWLAERLMKYSVVNWPTYSPRLAKIRWFCVRQTEWAHKELHRRAGCCPHLFHFKGCRPK